MQAVTSLLKRNDVIHFPTLKTVLMVEDVIRKSDGPITREEIKRRLRGSVMHQTLNVVLEYLEERGLIYDGRKGVTWLEPPNAKMRKMMSEGIRA
ncbi:hypothetical protein H0N95_02540 [Candidatus Micrarchaeota archaeon]|nr:hypothetical protein [Candidatus Micrarchaeota archaeon]